MIDKNNESTRGYTSDELIALELIKLLAKCNISIWDAEDALDRAKSMLKCQFVVSPSIF